MIQIITSNQTNPYWNVALENYLVAQCDDCVTLYLWKNRRTVVVGQNQNPFAECNVDTLLADGGYLMRRSTGGGAVYHDDGNINFSFVAPAERYDQNKQFQVICRALAAYGLTAQVSGRNDMTVDGRKFSGNAFSRNGQRLLHHGTILIGGNIVDMQRYLKVKPAKLQKHGVQSVQSRVVNLKELADVTSENIVPHLCAAFEAEYGEKAQRESFDEMVKKPEVVALYDKFSSDAWLYARWRNFTAQHSAQFAWGGVELSVVTDQQRGVITDVQLATDALETTLCSTLGTLLIGQSIRTRLELPETLDSREMIEDILSLIY